MKTDEQMRDLISSLLTINPEPSDEQFHMLARSAGLDPETLEAVAYEMLAEDLLVKAFQIEASRRLNADSQEVLDDPYLDPNLMSLPDIALNDGDPTDEDPGLQDETLDDGADVRDVGVGLTNGDDDVLTDDGAIDRSF